MSTHFHVDSTWRDRTTFPNPAEFIIPVEVANDWITTNRTVQAVRPHNKAQVTNIVHTIKLLNITIPFDFGGEVGTSFIDNHPFIYVAFQSTSMYKDMKLINTLNSGRNAGNKVSLKDAVFVAYCDKTQGGATSSWIQYKCNMFQTYRINLKDALTFRIFTNDGKTLGIVDTVPPESIDTAKQVNALFEVTPYVREDRYDNHFVTLYDRDA